MHLFCFVLFISVKRKQNQYLKRKYYISYSEGIKMNLKRRFSPEISIHIRRWCVAMVNIELETPRQQTNSIVSSKRLARSLPPNRNSFYYSCERRVATVLHHLQWGVCLVDIERAMLTGVAWRLQRGCCCVAVRAWCTPGQVSYCESCHRICAVSI